MQIVKWTTKVPTTLYTSPSGGPSVAWKADKILYGDLAGPVENGRRQPKGDK